MTFDDEWKILVEKSSNRRDAIHEKYNHSSKVVDNSVEDAELREERTLFYKELEELKKKYGITDQHSK